MITSYSLWIPSYVVDVYVYYMNALMYVFPSLTYCTALVEDIMEYQKQLQSDEECENPMKGDSMCILCAFGTRGVLNFFAYKYAHVYVRICEVHCERDILV